MHYLNRSKKNI